MALERLSFVAGKPLPREVDVMHSGVFEQLRL